MEDESRGNGHIAPESRPGSHIEERAELLRALAKRNIEKRRQLIRQALNVAALTVTFFVLVNNWGEGTLVLFGYTAFLGLRLLWRAFQYFKPSLRKGVGAYMREYKARQLASEYRRLEELSEERMADEFYR